MNFIRSLLTFYFLFQSRLFCFKTITLHTLLTFIAMVVAWHFSCWLSVTRRYCIKMAKTILKLFDHLVAPSF